MQKYLWPYTLVLMLSTSTLISTATHAEDNRIWQAYYQQSTKLKQADQQQLQSELNTLNTSNYTLPTVTRYFGFNPKQDYAWYRSVEGKAIVEAMISLQTPSGGWSKRTDMTQARKAGQHWGVEPKYVPTFDNSATSTQLRVLARAYSATQNPVYAEHFYRGLALILQAQYPHGGWPQNYPLVGGYHDHVTINDEVTEELLGILLACSNATDDFSFIAPHWQTQAQAALDRGVQFLLSVQLRDQEGLSVWAAQYDHRTLQPEWARAYEMPALAVMESASLLDVLMQIPQPDANLQQAIHGAVNWLTRHAIYDVVWDRTERVLKEQPGAGPTWPRFAELATNKPIFGDRDHQLYYDVNQVSFERRQGYAWYSERPKLTLKRYERWAKQWPLPLVKN